MAKRKQTPNTPGEQILSHYDLKDAQDVQNVMKQIFGPILNLCWKAKWKIISATKRMSALPAATMHAMAIRKKTLKTSLGEVPIRVPRDRQGTFEPQVVKKHQKDVFLPLRAKSLPCMHVAWASEISQTPLKIFTVLRCHTSRFLISQTVCYKRLTAGARVRSNRSIRLLL